MEERADIKRREMQFLAAEYQKRPELFEQLSYLEDAEFLHEFGIVIPGKEGFLPGTLKLWPEDFIVEEVGPDGALTEVREVAASEPGEGPTVYATLVKCGLSTLEAVDDLCRKLGLERQDISYAGIKDKDALTSQRISLRRTTLEAVQAVSSQHFFLTGLRCGKGVVEKGRLRGNRFTVLVRTQTSLDEPNNARMVAAVLAKVRDQGFYNFFYLQRFGTPRLRNYEWAYHILRGDYEHAVRDILTAPSDRELGYFKELRGRIEAAFGNWAEVQNILEPFPLMLVHERKIVEHLASHPGDYAGALKTIPDQITLWIYALASLFFNQKISEYLRKGKEPPERLPFILSDDRHDVDLYRDILQRYGLYPLPFKNLRPFSIVLKKRDAPTKDRIQGLRGEVLPEGLLLRFELGKGQYATTFLSHLFNLTAGGIPQGISHERVDTTAALKKASLEPILERFASVIRVKRENTFEALLQKEAE